ncbi:DUF6879 family protein [Streptomyces sp. NPDC088246]|uniref:DUF6879 family protein n=1 Tax=Streptomyces sp. NPDC088246 TaxID=3365842 RepID=UPI0037F83EF3
MLAALDLATGKLYCRIRPRERRREFLGLLKVLRTRRPGEKPYAVLDNFFPHSHAEVRAWAAGDDIELVFLPAYGSWLNWIEAEFAALPYFALNGTDHRSHAEQTRPSPPTSAGAMPAPNRRCPSRPTHRSVHFTGSGDWATDGKERTDDPAAAALCATAFETVWERGIPHEKYTVRAR